MGDIINKTFKKKKKEAKYFKNLTRKKWKQRK